MMSYFLKRLSEGSTWGGLAALSLGLGQVFKIDEAPAIADALGSAGQLAVNGDLVGAGVAGVFGVVAALIRDKD